MTGAIAVFSKVTVVQVASFVFCVPCITGAVLVLTCVGCWLEDFTIVLGSGLLDVRVSLAVDLHKLV